jgi:hypothetical protein
MFVMVDENFDIEKLVILILFFIGMDDCGDNSGIKFRVFFFFIERNIY